MGVTAHFDPLEAAAVRADSIGGGPYVVYLSEAQRIRDDAVTNERANYDGAMADLDELVRVAREVVAGVTSYEDTPIGRLARHLERNYPEGQS